MGTWIIGAVVVCTIGAAAYRVYKNFKNEKSCECGGESCSGCPGAKESP